MKGLTGFFIAVERVLVYPMNDPFLTGHLFLPAWSSLSQVACKVRSQRTAFDIHNHQSHKTGKFKPFRLSIRIKQGNFLIVL